MNAQTLKVFSSQDLAISRVSFLQQSETNEINHVAYLGLRRCWRLGRGDHAGVVVQPFVPGFLPAHLVLEVFVLFVGLRLALLVIDEGFPGLVFGACTGEMRVLD